MLTDVELTHVVTLHAASSTDAAMLSSDPKPNPVPAIVIVPGAVIAAFDGTIDDT